MNYYYSANPTPTAFDIKLETLSPTGDLEEIDIDLLIFPRSGNKSKRPLLYSGILDYCMIIAVNPPPPPLPHLVPSLLYSMYDYIYTLSGELHQNT